ncbi:hypothetical protein AAFC00_002513 [Neodothiora populina]|uniref:Zn(2)-C6 fungal-type domain-containing protein n=1 Tax=Neodothiora populina TaxID=2781224 RepID=A0ABR3P7C6_9PEZI
MNPVKAEGDHETYPSLVAFDSKAAEEAARTRLARKRTKTGCLTCRKRRIKCDEGKPICKNCYKSRRQCEGYDQRVVFKPIDFQYLGPYGAATITFHTSMLPGPTIDAPQRPSVSYGQPELRPRISVPMAPPHTVHPAGAPFQFVGAPVGIPQPAHPFPPSQHYAQPYQWNSGPPVQGHESMGIAAPPSQPYPHAPFRYGQPPVSHLSQPPENVQLPFRGGENQNGPYDHFQGPQQTQQWPSAVLPHQTVDSWNTHVAHAGGAMGPPWHVGPSRVTISQTQLTTTVEHDWPGPVYFQRPDHQVLDNSASYPHLYQQPQQQHQHQQQHPQLQWMPPLRQQQPPQPQQQQHHDVKTETVPGVTASITPARSDDKEYYQSLSPAGILQEAAIEAQDDDYYDIDEQDDMELEVGVKILEAKKNSLLKAMFDMTGVSASVSSVNSFVTFIYDGILNKYRPEWAANPLKNPATARVFAHFITATGPLLTTFVRGARHSMSLPQDDFSVTNNRRLWTYVMPVMALQHQGLLQAMLAISSLHIAKLQCACETSSMKHYGYALKRIHRSVRSQEQRHSVATLAATLLLGYYEIVAANHTNWNTHLAGAKQLVIELDFAEMTRKYRHMKLEKARRDEQKAHAALGHSHVPTADNVQDSILDQIPNVAQAVTDFFAGQRSGLDERGRVLSDSDGSNTKRGEKLDLLDYDNLRELYWWYCKQDVYQSIISGNPLLLEFIHWTDCPPRAVLGDPDAVHGSFDHLMLLLARIADFTSRDRKRKLRVMRANGGAWRPPPDPQTERSASTSSSSTQNPGSTARPVNSEMPGKQSPPKPPVMPFFGMAPPPAHHGGMPSPYKPRQDSNDEEQTHAASPASDTIDLTAVTTEAVTEWGQIKAAVEFFASHLGPAFQPLSSEFSCPTPFGPALVYQSWEIGCLWALYNLSLIVLHRSHPHMPPAAHMAAGVAAMQTKDIAMTVGRIAAGIPMPPPDQLLQPYLASSLCELSVPLFFAGIQFQAPNQRLWLIDRLYSVDRRAGWATAGIIAEGCQTAWIKAAAAGRGPPHERVHPASFVESRVHYDSRVYAPSTSSNVGGGGADKTAQSHVIAAEHEDSQNDRRFVRSNPAARLHWGIGVIGGEDDVVDSAS